jgi:hypothetical protein
MDASIPAPAGGENGNLGAALGQEALYAVISSKGKGRHCWLLAVKQRVLSRKHPRSFSAVSMLWRQLLMTDSRFWPRISERQAAPLTWRLEFLPRCRRRQDGLPPSELP